MKSRDFYAQVGTGGVRYWQYLEENALGEGRASSFQFRAVSPTISSSVPPPLPSKRGSAGGFTRTIVDVSADSLVEALRSQRERVNLWPIALGVAVIGFLGFFAFVMVESAIPIKWLMLFLGVVGLAVLPWALGKDERAQRTRIHYVLDEHGTQAQEKVAEVVENLTRVNRIWRTTSVDRHGDWKRNAGAHVSIGLKEVSVVWERPRWLETNVRIGVMRIGDREFFFFPDRILIFSNAVVRALKYTDLQVKSEDVYFREQGSIPSDTEVIGKTWRFVNKDGSRDLRFNNNYQIPIVHYGSLELTGASGLQINLQTSSSEAAHAIADGLRELKSAFQKMEGHPFRAVSSESFPVFAEQNSLSPALPKVDFVRPLWDLILCRWLDDLPEWVSPIAWGLLLALLPLSALLWNSHKNVVTVTILGSSLVLVVGGVGRLVYEWSERKEDAADEKIVASKSRFRALLVSELRLRPLGEVNFSELHTESDLSRADADQIADELFLKMIIQFLEDGILSSRERAKLETLARTLEIDVVRADRLEAQAKIDRYQQAVDEALKDGTVTVAEARLLNDLRSRFGIEGERWIPSPGRSGEFPVN